MSKIKTFLNLIISDDKKLSEALFLNIQEWRIVRLLNDKIYLKWAYKSCIGQTLDLDNPRTFNEKLQWLKLYNRNPEYSTMVDKAAVKEYVANKIGAEYVIPTLGVWKDPNDIEWDSLPEKFVVKWNHDSGSIVICKDPKLFDRKAALKKLYKGSIKNGFWFGREWPYKNVKPVILAEVLLEDSSGEDIKDYKFFCFNGKVQCFKVDFDRFSKHGANYYDRYGKILPFGEVACPPNFDKQIVLPNNLNKMIELAEVLSESMPFARIDFYDVDDNIYFGEITFFPASGFGPFTPDDWDLKLGNLITLPSTVTQ